MGVDVYLARHAEAEPGHSIPDSHRSLTGVGRRRARIVGQILLQRPEIIDTVWTSPLVRAVQTSEIFSGALGIDKVAAHQTIVAPPDLNHIIDLIVDSSAQIQGLMVVGHQPTLGLLISLLLQCEYPRPLSPGTVVALNVDRDRRTARFRWSIEGTPPAVVERLDA